MGIKLGDLDLQFVSGGQMRLDGGTMFGVVPKVLWQRKCQPDARNRILLDTNCLLVRGQKRNVLIDTGYGTKGSRRHRNNYALEDGRRLLTNLSKWGVDPGDIDVVILTHLHFDHAGGCTVRDKSGRLRPTFPRARYLIQRSEWEDACADLPELEGAYMKQDCVPLEEAGVLDLIDGRTEVLPGMTCCLTGGHSRGHQILYLTMGMQRVVYLGDLCPTSAHLPVLWTMAYDQYPLDVKRLKAQVLSEAADNHWPVLFDHDPVIQAAILGRDAEQQFVVRDVVSV